MEELRSTAILDREIQDDARRKAEKILKLGEAECHSIASDVTARVAQIQAQKEAEYKKSLDAYVKDAESAIPLEKQRRLVTFIDTSVQDALDAWFTGIGAEKRLNLLEHLLEKYISVLADRKLKVTYTGYPEADITRLVTGIYGKDTIESITCLTDLQAAEEGFTNGLCLETNDNSIRCRATLTEIRKDLLSTKRQELAEALMGGRLPE